MAAVVFSRSRTGWDLVLGALLVVAGLVVLGNAVIATTVSVLFLGWMLLLSGILGLASALVHIRHGGFWSSAVAGGLLTVIGLMCLRHTDAAALTLTLIAGSLFLATGLVRLIAAVDDEEYRWPLVLGGGVSLILGLIVLFNLFDASFTLLGVLLGIEVLSEGIAIMVLGRLHVSTLADPASPASTG